MMILAVIMENIMPNSNLSKYCRLVLSLVIMLMIITPISKFSFGIEKIEDFIYEAESIVNMNNNLETIERFEGMNNEQVVAVYKGKLKENISRTVEEITDIQESKVEVTINDKINSNDFGTIISLVINISKSNQADGSIKEIEAINISGNYNFEAKEATKQVQKIPEEDKQLIDRLIEELSRIYGLSKNSIEVEID
jgi:stage III sporulation protein AF